MKSVKKKVALSLATVMLSSLFTACSKGTESPVSSSSPSAANESTGTGGYNGEPATVKFLVAVDDDTFNRDIREPIAAKFPNIKLELVDGENNPKGLQELYAKSEIPDLISGQGYAMYKELDMLEPLDPYIKRTRFDLGVFRDGIVDNIRALDPEGKGQLYGLPLTDARQALYYNKDIFDKFGVPYLKDGMTWDELLDTARKLTGERDGMKYKGFSFGFYTHAFSQLGASGTDPKTGEVLLRKDPAFKRFFELVDKYKKIPGMIDTSDYKYSFTKEKNIAMYVGQIQHIPLNNNVQGLNFDLVTVPTWPDLPNVASTAPAVPLNLNKHSKNKDAAWAVLTYMASDEYQIRRSRGGTPPTVTNQKAIEQFAADVIEKSGKTYNVKAPFMQKLAKVTYSPYGPFVNFRDDDFINKSAREFTKSDKDIETYLREMEDQYSAIVAEMKNKK